MAIVGTSDAADQMRAAAELLGWPTVQPPGAALVYVADVSRASWSERPDPGAHVAVSATAAAALGRGGIEALARSAASLRIAEPFASAPAVQRWLRSVAEMDGITHLSGLTHKGPLAPSLVTVGLYAGSLAGWSVAPAAEVRVIGHDRQALDLHDPTAERTVSLAFNSVRPDWPEWEFQAASPTSVARIALLPWPRLEADGTTTDLPTAHPATDFGFEPFLRTWWDDVRAGLDDRPDDDFVDVLLRSLELLSS